MHQLLIGGVGGSSSSAAAQSGLVGSYGSSMSGATDQQQQQAGSNGNTPKELSDHDDLATAAVVDPYLEFKTHKMNLRYRGPKAATQRFLRKVVTDFVRHQNYDLALQQLLSECDWVTAAANRKSKAWQKSLREHVRVMPTLVLAPLRLF